MSLNNEIIQQKLTERFGEEVFGFEEQYGLLSFETEKDNNLKVLNFLTTETSLGFSFLTDICGVHYPDNTGKELGVVYHLHNMNENVRVRLKVFTSVISPEVFTATGLFEAANWMERETFDFYGILFKGHPNLKRILNVDEMDYYPLRKEFPLEDQSRVDKDNDMFGR